MLQGERERAGISGAELADRAALQAKKFDARITVPAQACALIRGDGRYLVRLEDGTVNYARSVVRETSPDEYMSRYLADRILRDPRIEVLTHAARTFRIIDPRLTNRGRSTGSRLSRSSTCRCDLAGTHTWRCPSAPDRSRDPPIRVNIAYTWCAPAPNGDGGVTRP